MVAVIFLGAYWYALFRLSMLFWFGWFRLMPDRFRWSDRRLDRFTYYLLGMVSITGFHIQMGRFVLLWL